MMLRTSVAPCYSLSMSETINTGTKIISTASGNYGLRGTVLEVIPNVYGERAGYRVAWLDGRENVVGDRFDVIDPSSALADFATPSSVSTITKTPKGFADTFTVSDHK